MAGPARAGVLIYARHLETLARFYRELLELRVLAADAEHVVAECDDIQLVLHVMPPQFAAEVTIAAPPEPREQQAIKPFFTVPNLEHAELRARELGGYVFGLVWDGPGFKVRNACDAEGNIIQLRQRTA